ncbi:MAG: hypothetical protein M1832_006280 [Thelocarpon impressellum]|nr:MAG: hypothetical protein M1832_006280 [Thelocarpon impressellum]
MEESNRQGDPESAFDSPTFNLDMSIRVDQPVGSMSISPCGRDVVLASRQGLHILDLDSPYSPPRHLPHRTPWEVADVQWSPFAARDYWVVSTSNQKALVWNLAMKTPYNAIEHVLHAHTRAITDINFSAHHPDILATCAVDSFVHSWDLRNPARPSMTFCDWFAGATQVKWNRQDPHILASSHDKFLRIWDDRKGAYPLRSIEAHDTKIYGVDWNRVRATALVTCSLDRSIKAWDYQREGDEPEQVIRTPFPVWRSRHTPFGMGLLVMPQRCDTDLHLFDRRLEEGAQRDAATPAVRRFEGHQDQVKEFLWRPRGNIVDGIDNRDFQLVSWGTDRDLRLHRVDDETLQMVGYQKGSEVCKKFNLTRKDAVYKTFRDGISKSEPHLRSRSGLGVLRDHGFSSVLGGALSAGMNKAPIPLSRGWGEAGYMTSRIRVRDGKADQKKGSAVAWMKGVRIGKKSSGDGCGRPGSVDGMRSHLLAPDPGSNGGWDAPDNLGDEITQVADKFSKVTFEDVDISKRTAVISMDGPWASEGDAVYTKVDVRFPLDYPTKEPPVFKMEKTPSISEKNISKISEELSIIAESYSSRGRGCLEAVLCYLLGERRLEDSTAWPLEDSADHLDAEVPTGESSSDDEDEVGPAAGSSGRDLELSGTDLMGTANTNANMPLPKACGAMFAMNGSLVCFFPPKEEKSWPGLPSAKDDEGRPNKGWKIFQGFGRLRKSSPSIRARLSATNEEDDEDYNSADDSFSSSSSSSTSSAVGEIGRNLFDYAGSWRRQVPKSSRYNRTRSTEYSQRSTGRGSVFGKIVSPRVKSIVSIHNLEGLLPAKKSLAEEYLVFGDGPRVCEHNANVAARHGFDQLADIWQLAKLILYNEVPLEIMEQHHRKEPILVVAGQAVARANRLDSALDCDDSPLVAQTRLTARVKWGKHPLGGAWLIDAMFHHFERIADVQMLAMLSCVFSEPSNKGGVSNAIMNLSPHEIPMSMKSPAFSLDYFPSPEFAWSLYQVTISMPSTPKTPYSPAGTFGSVESTGGQWGNDAVMPHSTGTTPSLYYKSRNQSTERMEDHHDSLSSSPNLRPGRRSTSSLTSAFAASLSRPFSTGANSSPPAAGVLGRRRPNALESTGGVTWGTNTIFGPAIKDTPVIYDAADSESEGEEEMLASMSQMSVKVTMKNQNLFDCEAGASVPLLDPRQTSRYKAYREDYATLLAIWGLQTRRLEVLKFNGMRNYFSEPLPSESIISLGKKRDEDAAAHAWRGLDVGHHCARCGHHLLRGGSQPKGSQKGSQCQGCSQGQKRMACSLCKAVVRGTYAPCLVCGHVMHSLCHSEWFGGVGQECPTGCGCACPDVTLEVPPIAFAEDVEAVGAMPDERRLPTVAESPDSTIEWEGWEDVGNGGRDDTPLDRDLRMRASAIGGTRVYRKRGRFERRPGKVASRESLVRESPRGSAKDEVW